MRQGKMRVVPCALALAMALGACLPGTAWALSPEFARTPEEWATLRDDVLEFGEIPDLIEEYNVTVRNNQSDYQVFLRDYGATKDDVSEKYLDMADEIEGSIDYPDTDDASYAMSMAAIVQNQSAADSLRKQADDNVQDAYVVWLGYQSAKGALVAVAKGNLISYERQQLELENAIARRGVLAAAYELTSAKYRLGMALRTDLLTDQEALQSQDAKILGLQSDIENTRRKLITMTGWKSDATPEITPMPAPDWTAIAELDLASDTEAAIGNNYTLLANKRKLDNAVAQETKDNLTRAIASNEQNITTSMANAYRSILSARASYDMAVAQAQAQVTLWRLAGERYRLGQISRVEYDTAQVDYAEMQRLVGVAQLNVWQALVSYESARDGMAGA
jgi:outer membrane protein TolC